MARIGSLIVAHCAHCRKNRTGHRYFVECDDGDRPDLDDKGREIHKRLRWDKYTDELISAVLNLREQGIYPTAISVRLNISYHTAYRIVKYYWHKRKARAEASA